MLKQVQHDGIWTFKGAVDENGQPVSGEISRSAEGVQTCRVQHPKQKEPPRQGRLLVIRWCAASMQSRQLFLDLELFSLELGYQRFIRERPGHFGLDLPFDAGVLGLKSADMRRFHAYPPKG